jgi:SAM-dependent methyltransferase
VDGIPVLLPAEAERHQLARTDWSAANQGTGSAAVFYNRTQGQDNYYVAELPGLRSQIEHWLAQAKVEGPVLEIGSGKGILQGIGGDYVALDYSLTALQRYIGLRYQRVCATSERLPFFDDAFRFVFSVTVLEHVPNPDLALGEIHRVLKPGGMAFLAPAWHCVAYNCEGIPVRPYRDLTWRQKLTKLSLPVRKRPLAKALWCLPGRFLRRTLWSLRKRPSPFHYQRLPANYERFWMADSDAVSRLDAHEACLFFHSRAYQVLRPGPRAMQQLFARHEALIVRKPVSR